MFFFLPKKPKMFAAPPPEAHPVQFGGRDDRKKSPRCLPHHPPRLIQFNLAGEVNENKNLPPPALPPFYLVSTTSKSMVDNGIIALLNPRLHIPAGILGIPVFSVPVAFFSQESRFLFRRNFFRTSSGNLSVWGLRRKLRRISIC
jgi:hypothetical protein